VRRGDVWWVAIPDEQPRPYVILTRPEAIAGLEKIVAAPATRTIRGIATEVQVGPDDGMRVDSVINLDGVTVIPKEFLHDRIATLGPHKMHEVCAALDKATGCD